MAHNYPELLEKSTDEIYTQLCSGVPGMRDFEIPKAALETKNADKIVRFTEALVNATNGLKFADLGPDRICWSAVDPTVARVRSQSVIIFS